MEQSELSYRYRLVTAGTLKLLVTAVEEDRQEGWHATAVHREEDSAER